MGRGRVRLTNADGLVFVQLYRWFPSILKVLQIIRPETLLRWHRAGFRSYTIDCFHPSSRSFMSSVPRRSCAGIGPGFAATGDGSPGTGEGVRRSIRTYGR